MFSNKMNNSGWILCPSKRFPGKFYYYNVLNGESAWCFNDTEKKFLRIDDKTQLITQKWHTYPEPISPPGKGHNSFTRSNSLFPHKFGLATFPKYFSSISTKQSTPNVLKKPIFDIQNIKKTEVPKKNIDVQTDLPETEIIVQYCKEPLSKRFWKYQNYDNENKTMSIKINWPSGITESEKQILDSTNKNDLESSNIFTNTTNKINMEESYKDENRHENLFLINQNSDRNKTKSLSTYSSNKINLADNDLRYILQAKKSEEKTEEPQKKLEPKNPIKKVRFDLSFNDNDDDSDLRNEMEIIDTSTSTPARIIKHIDNTEKSVNLIESQHHNDDDLKNIKFVVKNSNPKNVFLQNEKEINPFHDSKEQNTNFGKMLKQKNIGDSLDFSKQNEYITSAPDDQDSYEILNQDVLNMTKSVQEKLYVRPPNEKQFGNFSKIRFLKSTAQENPFKKYKKINPYIKYQSLSKISASCPALFSSNKITGNYYKVPHVNSLGQKDVSSSKRGVNYFDLNLYRCNSGTTNYSNNSISISDNADSQTDFGYSHTNAKVTEGCITFSETNRSVTQNNWLDGRLKKFYSRNSYIEKMVVIRRDEIICWFTQIMEDMIYDILETSTCPPPYTLYDAILCLQRRFSEHTIILEVLDKITDLDLFSSKTGYLKDNVHPYELIKALGCGLVFIEALNDLQKFYVKDAESSLMQLLRDIEDPQCVELPQPTTTVSRDSTEQPDRANFIKGRSDILTYLRDHFPEWQNYEEPDQVPIKNTVQNVVVTTGKDLHLFKINSKNQMYREPEDPQPEASYSECDDNKCDAQVIRKFHVIEKFENRISDINPEDISSNSIEESKQISNSNNTNNKGEVDKEIGEENNSYYNNEPTQIDNCYDDYKNSDESVIFIETEKNNNDTKRESSPHVDNSTRINESSTFTDDFPVLNNDPLTHYYADDANQYYLFVKHFLTELSSTLLLIHTFVKDNVDRFQEDDITDENRRELHEEANQTYINLKDIILDLKSIIDRETRDENVLRVLLICADEAVKDKRITNYRQVISKCLEQARHLAGCLRLLLRATDRDCTLSASSDAGDTTCINIFE